MPDRNSVHHVMILESHTVMMPEKPRYHQILPMPFSRVVIPRQHPIGSKRVVRRLEMRTFFLKKLPHNYQIRINQIGYRILYHKPHPQMHFFLYRRPMQALKSERYECPEKKKRIL